MHYYQFNIGDYQSHTTHLDETEDLAYRRLLDWCYLHERPLPLEPDACARLIRMRTHSERIETVLKEFFNRTEEGWVSSRVERELAKVTQKSSKARESANARWNKDLDATAMRTHSDSNATQDTRHKIQEPIYIEAIASHPTGTLPGCPHKAILQLWKETLPHLSQPRAWEGARQQALKARWCQAAKKSEYSSGYATLDGGLEWWRDFFAYIATDTSLANGFEHNGRLWLPDLPWVINASNFQKIVDGKYAK